MKKAILAAIPLMLAGAAMPVACTHTQAQDATPATTTPAPGRFIAQDDFVRAAESTVNGVVSVKSFASPNRRQGVQQGGNYFDDPFFEFFFGSPRGRGGNRRGYDNGGAEREQPQQQQIGLGSGVIISADGYIVTNNHVIADAERLEVTLNDNRNFEATVIGSDPTTDLALIRIDAPADLHVIPMGNSEDLRLGEWVLAVGNPFGFTSTVTSGIVSAQARNISTTTGTPSAGGIEAYIQTDAAVNRGNSGGALVNLRGELVGINTAIYSQTGTYAGCSFAIPTSIVQKVTADLQKYGTVQRAYLGIRFVELSPELISEKKIKGVTTGIYVAEVEDRSAAMETGLKPGDVIVAIDSYPVRSTAEMQEVITRYSPGDNIEISFFRDGERLSRKTTLRNSRGTVDISRRDDVSALGATFEKVDEETCRRLLIKSGVRVREADPDGRFYKAGIRKGFIILSINNIRIASEKQITDIYESLRQGSDRDKVMFITGILPSGRSAYFAVPLAD